jgi:branched-subunit amino acid aminotransferase/4-amino-4-deoxychorismate lyase
MTGWLRFDGFELVPAHPPTHPAAAPAVGAIEVADSWLVDDGWVRGLERHWARFERGCAESGIDAGVIAGVHAAVEHALPATGRWFPRVELRTGGELCLAVRPAPPRDPAVVAWVCDGPDPRRLPRRKGPDFDRLGAVREEAARRGAGEALLTDADGRLLEGAYTSLMWWEGEALCAVPPDAPILDGVTRGLLLDVAERDGVPVRFARPAPADLAGREVWLTSALHGIRAVTGWADGAPAAEPRRAGAWQERLEALAELLPLSARDGRSADRAGSASPPPG